MDSKIRLVYSRMNAAWAFLHGDAFMRVLDYPLFFQRREDAVIAAKMATLEVSRDGIVSAID